MKFRTILMKRVYFQLESRTASKYRNFRVIKNMVYFDMISNVDTSFRFVGLFLIFMTLKSNWHYKLFLEMVRMNAEYK